MYLYGAYGLAFLIAVIIFMKAYRTRQEYAAASNVVYAKYSFEKLAKDQQTQVHNRAIELVESSSTKIRGFANEVERFGWYALAMHDLAIISAVPENSQWHKVKNPYVAILPGNMIIRGVCSTLATEYDISIRVSDADNYTGKKSGKKQKKKT